MSIEENKAIVRRLAQEVVQGGNLNLIDELFAPDYVPHDPSNPGRPGGLDGAKLFIGMLRSGLPDLQYRVEDLIV